MVDFDTSVVDRNCTSREERAASKYLTSWREPRCSRNLCSSCSRHQADLKEQIRFWGIKFFVTEEVLAEETKTDQLCRTHRCSHSTRRLVIPVGMRVLRALECPTLNDCDPRRSTGYYMQSNCSVCKMCQSNVLWPALELLTIDLDSWVYSEQLEGGKCAEYRNGKDQGPGHDCQCTDKVPTKELQVNILNSNSEESWNPSPKTGRVLPLLQLCFHRRQCCPFCRKRERRKLPKVLQPRALKANNLCCNQDKIVQLFEMKLQKMGNISNTSHCIQRIVNLELEHWPARSQINPSGQDPNHHRCPRVVVVTTSADSHLNKMRSCFEGRVVSGQKTPQHLWHNAAFFCVHVPYGFVP